MPSRLLCMGLLLAGSAGLGCGQPPRMSTGTTPQSIELYQPSSRPTARAATLIERPEYRLEIGDIVDLTYRVISDVDVGQDYHIAAGDTVQIRMPFEEKYDQQSVVQTDGRIRVILLGPVRAAGLTIEQLRDQLRAGYERYIKEPELSVDVVPARAKASELRTAISSGSSNRRVPVKPDGTIDAIYAPDVSAAGKTVSELGAELRRRYTQADLREIDISVQLVRAAPRRLFVLGEVRTPRALKTAGALSVLQAITAAGGMTFRADKQHVLLIRRRGLPLPDALVIDIKHMIAATARRADAMLTSGSVLRQDVWMADGDIVYVPPTGMAQAKDWVDQLFRRGMHEAAECEANLSDAEVNE